MDRCHRVSRTALAAAVLGLFALAAQAKELKVPSAQYPKIQMALDDAAPGDVVRVAKGVYLESVVVKTAELRVVGKDAVIDASYLKPCMSIQAERVTVEGFLFINGMRGLEVLEPEALIKKNEFRANHDAGLWVSAADCTILDNEFVHQQYRSISIAPGKTDSTTRIEGNEFQESGDVYLEGGNAIVRKNDFLRTDEALYLVLNHPSAETLVEKNEFRHVVDDSAVTLYVEGSGGARVANNRFADCAAGVYARAEDGPVAIEDNEFLDSDWEAIEVESYPGFEVVIEDNEIKRCHDDAIEAYGPEIVIRDNEIAQCAWSGIWLDGDGALIEGNEITTCGWTGIAAWGMEIRILDNEVRNGTADGIQVDGDRTVVEGNRSIKNQGGGITVFAGDALELRDNVCLGNGHEGIDNTGTMTVIVGNKCLGSALGIGPDIAGKGEAGNGTVATFQDNEYETGGAATKQRLYVQD